MDWFDIYIFIGLIFTGICIGIAIGQPMGQVKAYKRLSFPKLPPAPDILDAEILEDTRCR